MNIYWTLAALVTFVAWSTFMYIEGVSHEHAVCAAATEKQTIAQQGNTIAAQHGVIATVAQQQTVTQGVDHDYQAKQSLIDGRYASSGSVQPSNAGTACNSLPAAGSPPPRPHAAPARPLVTAVFGLSAKECDENTEQLYGLQAWIKGQQTIKQPGAQ